MMLKKIRQLPLAAACWLYLTAHRLLRQWRCWWLWPLGHGWAKSTLHNKGKYPYICVGCQKRFKDNGMPDPLSIGAVKTELRRMVRIPVGAIDAKNWVTIREEPQMRWKTR